MIEIEEKLTTFKIEKNKEDNTRLEGIHSEINILKEDYKNNAYLLVSYDKQNYLSVILLLICG